MGNLQASPSSSEEKYDVFISFRGEIRYSFANTLREALKGKHIKAFMDDESPKGEKISQLLNTIEESKISIVIFSKNYGSSKWCLRELVKIMERNKINKQTVIPVFYGVKPSAVREDSFVKLKEKFPEEVPKWKEALIDASRLKGWESEVTRPDTILVDAIVDDIYKKLTGDENIPSSSDFKGLIGLDERIKHVKSLLCLHETNVHETNVRIIGILGMGGIGKTTLARVIFNQISGHQFDGVCFIQDVREKLENSGGLDHLQEDILSKVLNDKKLKLDSPGIIPPIIKKRLQQMKIFIVLDDVDDFGPLQILARGVDGLGQGSRIIITSRDKLVLLNCEVDDQNMYEVKEFNHSEALQLFYNCAFNQNQPNAEVKKLSNDIVNYAGGNPLALTVLGSSLRGLPFNQKSKKVWESTVNKLRTNVDRRIFETLKISYDGLKDGEKGVFLDIACFLKGRDQDYVASILDDCECWLRVLIHKSLITVSHNTIQMHELLQDLGREIVRKQSLMDPGKRSRLWAPEDVQRTLNNNAGTSEVQGIFLDMSNINDMHLSPKTFKKMFNLRLLKFYESSQNLWELTTRSSNKVQFREGLNKVSFGELRSFIWYGYPLTVPSSNFDPKNLVEFDLSESNLERLWDDTKHAPKLRWLILRQCLRLTEIPDLSKSPLLERIDLRGCLSLNKILNLSKLPLLKEIILKGCSCLTEIPNLSESLLLERIDLSGCLSLTKILNLSKLSLLKEIDLNGCSSLIEIPNLSESPLLKKIDLNDCRSLLEFPLLAPRLNYLSDLNLSGCESIRSFPSTIIHFESIGSLNLSSCINLTTFPQISGNITCLDLSGTAIDEVPPSIENLIKLFHLALPKSIRLISTNICKLKSLWKLDLTNCFQLESFPEILDEMEGLEILDLSGTAIKELPHSIEELTNLSALYLSRCKNLEKLPSSISNLISLQQLNILDCPKLEKLPNNLGNLKSLEDLSIDGIIISQLPSTMMYLNIDVSITISCRGYRELRFTDLLGLTWGSLTSLDFNDCNLNKIPVVIGWLSSLEVLKLSGNNFESLPLTMKLLYNLTYLEVDNCNMLQSLTDLPSALRDLSASGCNMLQSLTELPSALRHLSASGCKQLQSIPDASEFENLDDAEFIFTNCLNLKETAVSKMLATLKKVYEEGKEIGELTFLWPGSKVPEWFMHRTEGSSIVEWHDGSNGRPLLGFVACAVIAFQKYCCIKSYLHLVYNYTCCVGDESSPFNIWNESYMRFGFGNETLIDSDHIAFGFCKTLVPRSDFSNCSFEFWFSNVKNPNCRIKSFGVYPIYAKHNITQPSFKKQKTIKTLDLFH